MVPSFADGCTPLQIVEMALTWRWQQHCLLRGPIKIQIADNVSATTATVAAANHESMMGVCVCVPITVN